MVLHTRHFPNASLRVLNNLSWGLVHPCYWLLNHLVASLITTTQEQQQCTQDPCASLTPCVLLITPLYLFCMILWLPIGLLGFLVWAPLQALRRPYVYSHRRVGHGEKGLDEWKLQQQSFYFATANVCLLPESLARFNNLSDTQGRACEVGRRIFGGACRPKNKISVNPPTSSSVSAASSQTFSFDKKPSSMVNGEQDGGNTTGPLNKELSTLDCHSAEKSVPDCPLHSTAQPIPDCPLHSRAQPIHDCPLHSTAQPIPDCPLHSTAQSIPDCPLHSTAQPIPDCPLHSTAQSIPDCPLHSTAQSIPDCPLHSTAQPIPDCPLHSTAQSIPDCPLHSTAQPIPDCPLHSAAQPIPDCPLHSTAQSIPDCPLHSTAQPIPDCPLHSTAQPIPDCPLHSTAQSIPDCPLHSTTQPIPDCPLHSTVEPTPDCPLHSTGQLNPIWPQSTSHNTYLGSSVHSPDLLTSHDCPVPLKSKQTPPDCTLHTPREPGIPISDSQLASKGINSVACVEGNLDICVTSQESLTPLLTGSRDTSDNSPSPHTSPQFKRCAGTKRHSVSDGINHEISAIFPANLDFLCLQEVFDRQATVKLKQQLHHYFPFILSDVGHYAWKGCCSRFKFFNSGLFLASQYPILDVEYHCYPNGRGEDAFASKGVLFVKVQVGKSAQDERVVGYIACTHLHSIEGHSIVRYEQLNMLLERGTSFKKMTKCQKDKVAFDVILGDLNFDNCSSVDKLEQQHVLFSQYKDPCRLRPGEDHCWAIGTLLEISGLYDVEVFTPERMQKVMESEQGRKEYLAYPTGEKNSYDQEGRKTPLKGNGRRIDYILYSEEGLQQDWKVAVEEYSFITQLAGLTDHLAVAMRLNVAAAEEDP